jgi:hypothetical protein
VVNSVLSVHDDQCDVAAEYRTAGKLFEGKGDNRETRQIRERGTEFHPFCMVRVVRGQFWSLSS